MPKYNAKLVIIKEILIKENFETATGKLKENVKTQKDEKQRLLKDAINEKLLKFFDDIDSIVPSPHPSYGVVQEMDPADWQAISWNILIKKQGIGFLLIDSRFLFVSKKIIS